MGVEDRCGVRAFGAAFGLATILGLLATPHMASGQDDDRRKIVDQIVPVHGPMLTGPMTPENGRIAEFGAHNVTLLSWMPLNLFPDTQVSANDCWGYVSASGREYILIGLRRGTGVLEVTNPTQPTLIGYVPGATSLWRDMKVIGDYAYAVSEGGLGIQVIDLRGVDSGTVVHVKNKTQNGHSSTHNIAANTDSGYLYLCGANIANGGLVAVSTTDPTDPKIVGSWNTRYVHDAQIVTYTDGPYAGKEIAFCCTGGAGLDVVDVTNKSNMTRIGGLKYPGTRYSHQGWLTEDRRYFLINDEMDEPDPAPTTRTHVIDVQNPGSPVYKGWFTSGATSTDHNLYIHEGKAYEANYLSGLRVFDVSDPQNAEQIAWFDTHPENDAAGYHGAWSCYPYLPSGTIAISDIERGLFLVRVGTDSLQFEYPDGLPTMSRPGVDLPVRVGVLEQGVTLDPATVRLHVRKDGSTTEFVMTEESVFAFTASIPAMDCYEEADFWFSATDTDGLLYTDVLNASLGGGHALMAATGDAVVFADDFSSDLGWTTVNTSVQSGAWARTQPIAANAYEPQGDYDGSGMAWVTGASPGEMLVGGPTELISPAFDLSGAGAAEVSYAAWQQTPLGNSPLRVHASPDGVTWTEIATHVNTPTWEHNTIRLDNHIPLTSQVRVRFSASSWSNFSSAEAGVDAFSIVAVECDDCLADYNGDGTVNTQDFLAFMNDFTGSTNVGNPDLNGDTKVDSLDFLAFLNAFVAGCP
ncbi:MAG TPA: choice-of-anchor B family protein [Phycisphaerales bacterium]|nr:choice-of-anchor B family protein [Phycisphaerales bacterium]